MVMQGHIIYAGATLSFATRRLAKAFARRLQGVRESAPAPDISRRTACLYLSVFVPVIAFVVLRNSEWTNHSADTRFHLSAYDMLERYSSLFSNANANPLEGLFDIFPHGLRLGILPNLIGRALFGPGMSLEFFLIFTAVLLAISVAAMARTVGMPWSASILAGILLPLMIVPVSGPGPLAEHFYIVSLTSYYSTAGIVFVTALFWRIDERSSTRVVVLTGAIVLILMHLSMTLIFFMAILAPAVVAFGLAALIASKSRGELLAKVTSAVIIAVALGVAGVFHYLYAIGSDTSFHVFYRELRDFMLYSRPTWRAVLDDAIYVSQWSLDFRTSIEGVLAPLCQLGAVYLAIFGATRESRLFGRTMLVWLLATMALFVVTHYCYYFTGHSYMGPAGPHFLPILWPYYAICLAGLIVGLVQRATWVASRITWLEIRRLPALIPHASLIAPLSPVLSSATFGQGWGRKVTFWA